MPDADLSPGILRFVRPRSRLPECLVQGCPLAAAYAETLMAP